METEGTQDNHPLVAEFLKPSPSLPFDLMRRKEDGSETAYPFRCRLLRYEQQNEALLAARKYTAKTLGIDPAKTAAIEQSAVFREAQAFETAWRACVHLERRKTKDGAEIDLPLFANPDQMRQALMVAEVAQMLNAFEVTKSFYGFSELTEAAVEKLIDVLADELKCGYFLSQLDSEEWPRLICILAQLGLIWRPSMPQTQSGSGNTSESGPSISESGTTGFSKLPESHVSGSSLKGMQLPTTGQITKDQARELVKQQLAQGAATAEDDDTKD